MRTGPKGKRQSTKIPEGVTFVTIDPHGGLIQFFYGPPEMVTPKTRIGWIDYSVEGCCVLIPTPLGREAQERGWQESIRWELAGPG